jgi:membrane dipeptidase
MRLLIDGHLDIGMNAVSYDRDQTWSVAAIREHEKQRPGKCRGRNTVSLDEMRKANVGICLATVLARSRPEAKPAEEPLRSDIDYICEDAAYAHARADLAYYEVLEHRGQLRQIKNRRQLDELADVWLSGEKPDAPIGYILSMEGADPIISPEFAQHWWELGLRTVCLAHYGPSAYAMGTGGDGPLTERATPLLKAFDEMGMILDLVHTADTALMQAMELFSGRVFVSHGNCRTLVPGDRQISDEQIKAIAQRDGIIGTVLDAWMLTPNWQKGVTTNAGTTLKDLADHIDHICQLVGDARHAAIGSDLDGGFGTEQSPRDLDTIADLHKVAPLLAGRGYSDDDIDSIFYGNWLRFFREALPAS